MNNPVPSDAASAKRNGVVPDSTNPDSTNPDSTNPDGTACSAAQRQAERTSGSVIRTGQPRETISSTAVSLESCQAEDDEGWEDEPGLPIEDPAVSQSYTRFRDEQDRDNIVAYFRERLCPGQKTAVVHLQVWPHFATRPQITANLFEGTGHCRVTQSEVFGCRIEIALDQPVSQPTSVIVEVFAKC